MNTPRRLLREMSQVLDPAPRPPGVLSQGDEYARYVTWLRTHSFALMEFNARQRKSVTQVFRNPVAAEPKFLGINDVNKKRR